MTEQVVTMTATVQRRAEFPAGNVVFSSDGMQIGEAILSNGVAVLNYSSLLVGTHSVVAVYQGGNGFAGSTSNTVQQVVTTSRQHDDCHQYAESVDCRTASHHHRHRWSGGTSAAHRHRQLHFEWHRPSPAALM